LLPAGSRRQRAYLHACPSERTASSGSWYTKFERRIGTNNDRNHRQLRLVIGRFGQRGQCSG
jgi:hypothetical protein